MQEPHSERERQAYTATTMSPQDEQTWSIVSHLSVLVPLIHGCYAAYRVSQGEGYRYPFIADRIDGGRRRIA